MAHPNYADPAFVYEFSNLNPSYKFVAGFLRWAQVRRGSSYFTGWVLCDSDGKALDYSGTYSTGTITINASGSYMMNASY